MMYKTIHTRNQVIHAITRQHIVYCGISECKDKLDNCFYFGDEQCIGRFVPWAKDNCPYRCGYCPGNLKGQGVMGYGI